MKSLREIVIVFLVGLIVAVCVGCSGLVEVFENEELRKNTETMLNAIVEDDVDAAYSTVDENFTKEDFVSAFGQMKDLLANVKDYDLSILSAHQNKNVTAEGVVSSSTASYKMTTSSGTYIVDVQIISPQEDLSSFHITPYEKTDYYSVGTVSNMSDASVFQWIMLFSNIVIIGFALFAFVDCCRQKIKLKALWLIIIIFGFLTVGATIAATSLKFNFNIGWFFAYNSYITYGGGTNVIRFMLPVGAIIYFILKNSMIQKAQICENDPNITPLVQPDGQNHDSENNINL